MLNRNFESTCFRLRPEGLTSSYPGKLFWTCISAKKYCRIWGQENYIETNLCIVLGLCCPPVLFLRALEWKLWSIFWGKYKLEASVWPRCSHPNVVFSREGRGKFGVFWACLAWGGLMRHQRFERQKGVGWGGKTWDHKMFDFRPLFGSHPFNGTKWIEKREKKGLNPVSKVHAWAERKWS